MKIPLTRVALPEVISKKPSEKKNEMMLIPEETDSKEANTRKHTTKELPQFSAILNFSQVDKSPRGSGNVIQSLKNIGAQRTYSNSPLSSIQ